MREIPGDGSTTQEVAIGGHLFESYIKQRANDDNSGCALTLEIGRAYIKLIKGKGSSPLAQTDDQLPVGTGDQRHECMVQCGTPTSKEGHHRRFEFRYGREFA